MKTKLIVALMVVAVSTLALSTSLYAGCGGCGTHTASVKKETKSENKHQLTIVETAEAAGTFKTLVAVLKAADLAETLSGKGPYTVFAPTDEAFAKLPKGTVESLLKDKQRLTEILTYHVVPGKVLAKEVVTLASAKTVEGRPVRFDSSVGVRVNQAKVLTPDVLTANGVIHIIDDVLVPN